MSILIIKDKIMRNVNLCFFMQRANFFSFLLLLVRLATKLFITVTNIKLGSSGQEERSYTSYMKYFCYL